MSSNPETNSNETNHHLVNICNLSVIFHFCEITTLSAIKNIIDFYENKEFSKIFDLTSRDPKLINLETFKKLTTPNLANNVKEIYSKIDANALDIFTDIIHKYLCDCAFQKYLQKYNDYNNFYCSYQILSIFHCEFIRNHSSYKYFTRDFLCALIEHIKKYKLYYLTSLENVKKYFNKTFSNEAIQMKLFISYSDSIAKYINELSSETIDIIIVNFHKQKAVDLYEEINKLMCNYILCF